MMVMTMILMMKMMMNHDSHGHGYGDDDHNDDGHDDDGNDMYHKVKRGNSMMVIRMIMHPFRSLIVVSHADVRKRVYVSALSHRSSEPTISFPQTMSDRTPRDATT